MKHSPRNSIAAPGNPNFPAAKVERPWAPSGCERHLKVTRRRSFLGNYVLQDPRTLRASRRVHSRRGILSRDGNDRRNSFRRSHLIADPTYWSIQWGIRWIIIVDFPSWWISRASFPLAGHNVAVSGDVRFILFLPWLLPLSFPFVDASAIARTRGQREQNPARSHPIERSRRTELNAGRVLCSSTSRERGQNRDKHDWCPRPSYSAFYIPIVD